MKIRVWRVALQLLLRTFICPSPIDMVTLHPSGTAGNKGYYLSTCIVVVVIVHGARWWWKNIAVKIPCGGGAFDT